MPASGANPVSRGRRGELRWSTLAAHEAAAPRPNTGWLTLPENAGLWFATRAAGCVDGSHDRRDAGVFARQVRCSCPGPFTRPSCLALARMLTTAQSDDRLAWCRFLFREFVAEQTAKYEWWQAVEHAIEHEGWKIVLLLRLTPLVPFNLLNYALACTAVRFWDYTWASSVGVLPGMVSTATCVRRQARLKLSS